MAPLEESQWPTLSEWDPEFREQYEANPIHLPDNVTPEQLPAMREGMRQMVKQQLYPTLDFTNIEQSTIDIPTRDGATLPSLLFKPSNPPAGGSPLALLFHGGGWQVGCAENEILAALSLAKDFGAVVVSVEYRLAPEHPFPGPVNDGWDALKYLVSKADSLGADLSKGLILGGSSAGGNIAAVLQHLSRDEGLGPQVTGVWLGYPVTTAPSAWEGGKGGSYEQNRDAPILTKARMLRSQELYQGDPDSQLFAPLNWTSGHAGLTRTYIQVCGLDPLRDDGLLYEQALRKAGVETKLDIYPGCPHVFEGMYPKISAARKFQSDRVEGFRWLLRK